MHALRILQEKLSDHSTSVRVTILRSPLLVLSQFDNTENNQLSQGSSDRDRIGAGNNSTGSTENLEQIAGSVSKGKGDENNSQKHNEEEQDKTIYEEQNGPESIHENRQKVEINHIGDDQEDTVIHDQTKELFTSDASVFNEDKHQRHNPTASAKYSHTVSDTHSTNSLHSHKQDDRYYLQHTNAHNHRPSPHLSANTVNQTQANGFCTSPAHSRIPNADMPELPPMTFSYHSPSSHQSRHLMSNGYGQAFPYYDGIPSFSMANMDNTPTVQRTGRYAQITEHAWERLLQEEALARHHMWRHAQWTGMITRTPHDLQSSQVTRVGIPVDPSLHSEESQYKYEPSGSTTQLRPSTATYSTPCEDGDTKQKVHSYDPNQYELIPTETDISDCTSFNITSVSTMSGRRISQVPLVPIASKHHMDTTALPTMAEAWKHSPNTSSTRNTSQTKEESSFSPASLSVNKSSSGRASTTGSWLESEPVFTF